MDNTRVAAGNDTSNLPPLVIDASPSPSDTKISVQDMDKAGNDYKSVGEFLTQHGMPSDNKDGRRDEFLNKVLDNSAAQAFRDAGFAVSENPTHEELGRIIEQTSFDQSIGAMGGIEGMKDELKFPKDATPEEVRKLFTPELFRQMSQNGANVTDFASAYTEVRKQGFADIKSKAGITD